MLCVLYTQSYTILYRGEQSALRAVDKKRQTPRYQQHQEHLYSTNQPYVQTCTHIFICWFYNTITFFYISSICKSQCMTVVIIPKVLKVLRKDWAEYKTSLLIPHLKLHFHFV
ncbi:hypothetical protein FKM82_015562 [Ascaphus truei]